MINEQLKRNVLANICALKEKCYNVVIVHGGGPFIQQTLDKAGIESEFIDGHRKTTSQALEYVEMSLKGKVNGDLVRLINSFGYKAVGLSGKDGKTVTGIKRRHQQKIDGVQKEVDLGHVGDVAEVNTMLLNTLLENDFIPVLASLTSDNEGNDYNINADMFAGHIAGKLNVNQYIVLTDVDGLLMKKDDPSSIIKNIKLRDVNSLISKNIIQGGMIPKMESCEIALNNGADSARIINGTKPEQILSSMENDSVGTLITK